MIFAGNHDTERIGDVVRKNPERLKLVMTMLATMRGIPQVFAGDEMMFTSKDLSQGHGGLRVDFPGGWAGDERNLFTAEGRTGLDKGALRPCTAALPVAPDQARDPQRPHDALPLARQHLRLLPLRRHRRGVRLHQQLARPEADPLVALRRDHRRPPRGPQRPHRRDLRAG